jgi:predicted MFS family arabinose efflux permease
MGPILSKLTQVSANAVGLVFAIYGVCGFIGIVVVSNIVDSWGALKTSILCISLVLAGVTGWALSAGFYPLMVCSAAIWGLGFASSNSMQQVRLVAAAPQLASASVSLNTSFLYVGQAIGSGIGGALYAHDLLFGIGYAGAAFVALSLITVMVTRNLASRRVAAGSAQAQANP